MNNETIYRFSRGDEGAFREIYEKYFPALCVFANKYVADRAVAQDVSQDAFVSLWHARHNFKTEPSLRSFLYVTVRNASINHLRHMAVHRSRQDEIGRRMLEADSPGPLIATETARRLIRYVEQLPRGSRTVLQLSIDGKSYKEIGEILNITVSTVRNLRIRAVKLLKKKIGDISVALMYFHF